MSKKTLYSSHEIEIVDKYHTVFKAVLHHHTLGKLNALSAFVVFRALNLKNDFKIFNILNAFELTRVQFLSVTVISEMVVYEVLPDVDVELTPNRALNETLIVRPS